MIDLRQLYDTNGEVRFHLTDDTFLEGCVVSIDDYETLGMDETGISVHTRDGRYVVLGVSEVESYVELNPANP